MKKIIVLYSGGMDSTVLLYEAASKGEAIPVSFNYGANHNNPESWHRHYHIKRLGLKYYELNLAPVFSHFESGLLSGYDHVPEGHFENKIMKKTVVPFRNGIMLSVAAGLAESLGVEEIWLASHSGDHAIYPDCRESFNKAMGQAIKLGTYDSPKLEAPFAGILKEDIAAIGHNRHKIEFEKTYSCYKGGPIQCGRCSTCFERREAFVNAGIPDKTEYIDKTPFKILKKQYLEELEN